MKVFLIIIAVLALLFILLLSLSVHATVVYDGRWQTTIQILFIEKDIELSKLINFVLFPEKAAKEKAEELKSDKQQKETVVEAENEIVENDMPTSEDAPKKANPINKMIDEDGIVGVLTLASNLVETVNSALITLFRGLHIYSLYVKMITGGGDAADIGMQHGRVCGLYYPIKGIILNGMRVDQYDELIQADFIAPRSEYEFQLIASMNVALVLKIALKAGSVFLINLIKNK